jgi:putative FmdB family regulatory protein
MKPVTSTALTGAFRPSIKLATMPTYEYVCAKCGHEFEKFQSIADKPLTVCPADLCAQKKWGRGKVKKIIGAGAGLIFKGSGFYITDYRSEKYKEAAKKDSAAAKPAGEGKTSSGETKSTAKPESKPAKSSSKD